MVRDDDDSATLAEGVRSVTLVVAVDGWDQGQPAGVDAVLQAWRLRAFGQPDTGLPASATHMVVWTTRADALLTRVVRRLTAHAAARDVACAVCVMLPWTTEPLCAGLVAACSGIRQLSLSWVQPAELPALDHLAATLRTLEICCYGRLASLSSIGCLGMLTTLCISECALERLPEQLGQLTALKTLVLKNLSLLKALPSTLGCLRQLTTLNTPACFKLVALPASIWQLTALTTLDMTNCIALEAWPEPAAPWPALTKLALGRCTNLAALPSCVGELTMLSHLDLSGCERLTRLPGSIGQLSALRTLNLAACSALAALPPLPAALQRLDLAHCTRMSLVDLSQAASLTHLTLGRLHSWALLLANLGCLPALTYLSIFGCSWRQLPDPLTQLPALTELHLMFLSDLTCLPPALGNLAALERLLLNRCPELSALPDSIGQLGRLRTLEVVYCDSLEWLPDSLAQLTALTTLDLTSCPRLRALPEGLGALSDLSALVLYDCQRLTHVPPSCSQLANLATLVLTRCYSLRHLPVFQAPLHDRLHLDYCQALTSIPETIFAPTLSSLRLANCSRLSCLPPTLGRLTTVIALGLSECVSLTTLPSSISGMASLEHLDLYMCQALTCLPDSLCHLPELVTLNLELCRLTRLPAALARLTKLTTLSLRSCLQLSSLPQQLPASLCVLELHGCTSLTALPESLPELLSLKTFRLNDCSELCSPLELPQAVAWGSALTACNEAVGQYRQRLLVLLLHGRRVRRYRLPAELWDQVANVLWQSQPRRWFAFFKNKEVHQ